MGGFATIIGFTMSFFVLASVFIGAFYYHQQEILTQVGVNEALQTQYSSSYLIDFSISSPYFVANRLQFDIENTGRKDLFYQSEEGNFCFDVYVNGKFIDQKDIEFGKYGGLNYNYNFLEPKGKGYLSLDITEDELSQGSVKIVSCEGISKEFEIENDNLNFFDSTWNEKISLNLFNPSNENLYEYQVPINLNSSDLDFNELNENEIRIVSAYDNFLALSLNFDKYQQILEDSSKNSNVAYLGSSNSIENNDPKENQVDSILFNSLDFNGSSKVSIQSNSVLELEEQATYSLWFKWDGEGDNNQYLYVNGDSSNSINIINDGGVNNQKLQFNLNLTNGENTLISDSIIQPDKWYYLTTTYDSNNMSIYLDSQLDSTQFISGSPNINTFSNQNFVGANNNEGFFSGTIDEVNIFPIALSSENINKFFKNNFKFLELDFHIFNLDYGLENLEFFVKSPIIYSNSNISFDLFYSSDVKSNTKSSIKDTFSYIKPREIGLVLSDRISGLDGLSILSLEENNQINIGTNSFFLDEFDSNNLGSAQISLGESVFSKELANFEGNGDAQDIINPISWAGEEFVISGTRGNQNRFCYVAPWEDSFVQVFENSAEVYNLTATPTPTCISQNLNQNANIKITSDNPILVNYYDAGSPQDSVVLYPVTNKDLFGIPSNNFILSSGTGGAQVTIQRSSLNDDIQTLNQDDVYSAGGNGAKGGSSAFRIRTSGLISAIQQADSDGVESSIFVPQSEFSTKFGSTFDMQYVVFASHHSDANCKLYDSTNTIVQATNGTGTSSDVFKYDFGNVGGGGLFQTGPWKIDCDKPVWGYYEKNSPDNDETNMFGYTQMRQFIHPTPFFEVSS